MTSGKVNNTSTTPPEPVDLLILGAGWLSQFLIPHLKQYHSTIKFSSTTRQGGGPYNSIPFTFHEDENDDDEDESQWKRLPDCQTLLITFPIIKLGSYKRFLDSFNKSRSFPTRKIRIIQLGSTGIYELESNQVNDTIWYDRHSNFNPKNSRAIAESELLSLCNDNNDNNKFQSTILQLAGLHGASRSLRHWIGKVAPTKETLSLKASVHLIHGLDVSRCIIAVHLNFEKSRGQRWILTDERVYDWWDLASAWGAVGDGGECKEEPVGDQAKWVQELMNERGIRSLPRSVELLGRALDSREFWLTFKLSPVRARQVI